jgi:WD40 repeat protein
MAYWQRGIALEQRNAALITQSLFLADLATQRINAYNQGAGISLALEALPDSETGITRPFVREAQVALSTAVQRLREIALFAGHGGPVTSAVFSPDGQRILTASEDGTAQIWSRDTGEVVSVLTAEKLRMKDAGFCLALRGQSREECACRVFGVWHERSFSQAGELGQAANPLCSCWGTCEMAKLS